jgi:hypothetical protein
MVAMRAAPCPIYARGSGIGNHLGMQLNVTTPSEATVEQSFAAHVERSVREQACRESGAVSWDISIERTGDGARVQVDRVMKPDLPDMVRSFVGESIKVRQIETWGGPDQSGTRRADVQVIIVGQPASMKGTAMLTPAGSGSVETVEGEVTVNVPFLGKKFEPDLVKVIAAALKIEQRAGIEWVRANA